MPYLVSQPKYLRLRGCLILRSPGHGVRCLWHVQDHLYAAIQNGDLNRLVTLLRKNPSMINANEEASYAKAYHLTRSPFVGSDRVTCVLIRIVHVCMCDSSIRTRLCCVTIIYSEIGVLLQWLFQDFAVWPILTSKLIEVTFWWAVGESPCWLKACVPESKSFWSGIGD